MKTYSEYTLNHLNKHSLIKIIKELYAIREEAIVYINNHRKSFSIGVNEEIDEFDYISTSPKALLDILQGNKEEE